ncbi:MAG: DHH family phosphoesterase [Candidatus Micrarchaeia archaeon]
MPPLSIFDILTSDDAFIVSSHLLSDIDGVCSSFLIHSLFPKSQVVFFDRPSRDARTICEAYKLNYSISSKIDPSRCVLVDVDDPSLIPVKKEKFMCIIDHHMRKTLLNATYRFSFPNQPSTTYVIYRMMKDRGITPTPFQADMILLGLIADTYRFKAVRDPSIFADIPILLRYAGKSYDELVALVERPPLSESERLVFARSFMNYRILRDARRKLVFILSDCDSFQSIVATRIVQCLAADFGLAYARYEKEGEVRISIRSSPSLGMHLGQFASELAAVLGGTGGGHMYAAGVNVPVSRFSDIEAAAVSLLKKRYSLTEYK